MKFGVREICDVVLRAKAAQKIGKKVFYKNEPVLYFDSLKTSSMEGQATTVYAQGGRGNARLIAWEGERTVTFTMEDALISPEGFSILTGAGLVDASEKDIIIHKTEITNKVIVDNNYVEIELKEIPYIKSGEVQNFHYKLVGKTQSYDENENYYKPDKSLYSVIDFAQARITFQASFSNNLLYYDEEGEEQVLATDTYDPSLTYYKRSFSSSSNQYVYTEYSLEDFVLDGYKYCRNNEKIYIKETEAEKEYQRANDNEDFIYVMLLDDEGEVCSEPFIASETKLNSNKIYLYQNETNDMFSTEEPQESDINITRINDLSKFKTGCTVLVDYYVKQDSGAFEINITPNKFGGNFYLEASTLFRATNGVDMPAEFIIPNCKIQSNFTFTMASSGDPSTFTFTMDAFPDYTRWDKTKKVFAAIQVIEESNTLSEFERLGTPHDYEDEDTKEPYNTYKEIQRPYLEDSYNDIDSIEEEEEETVIPSNGGGQSQQPTVQPDEPTEP